MAREAVGLLTAEALPGVSVGAAPGGEAMMMAMAVGDGGAALLVGNAVAVINAAVGGPGVAPTATQPAHNSAASCARHPRLRCVMF